MKRAALFALFLFSSAGHAQTQPAAPAPQDKSEVIAVLKSVKEQPETSVRQIVMQQVLRCWAPPSGVENRIPVKVLATLEPNGRFKNITIPKEEGPKYHTDVGYRAMANSAMRALMSCQPIGGLPADKYESWKELELTFDPRALPKAPATETLIQDEGAGAAPVNPFGGAPAKAGPAPDAVIPADQIH